MTEISFFACLSFKTWRRGQGLISSEGCGENSHVEKLSSIPAVSQLTCERWEFSDHSLPPHPPCWPRPPPLLLLPFCFRTGPSLPSVLGWEPKDEERAVDPIQPSLRCVLEGLPSLLGQSLWRGGGGGGWGGEKSLGRHLGKVMEKASRSESAQKSPPMSIHPDTWGEGDLGK